MRSLRSHDDSRLTAVSYTHLDVYKRQSSDVPAMMATDKVLYIERGGGRVYQYGYDYELSLIHISRQHQGFLLAVRHLPRHPAGHAPPGRRRRFLDEQPL